MAGRSFLRAEVASDTENDDRPQGGRKCAEARSWGSRRVKLVAHEVTLRSLGVAKAVLLPEPRCAREPERATHYLRE